MSNTPTFVGWLLVVAPALDITRSSSSTGALRPRISVGDRRSGSARAFRVPGRGRGGWSGPVDRRRNQPCRRAVPCHPPGLDGPLGPDISPGGTSPPCGGMQKCHSIPRLHRSGVTAAGSREATAVADRQVCHVDRSDRVGRAFVRKRDRHRSASIPAASRLMPPSCPTRRQHVKEVQFFVRVANGAKRSTTRRSRTASPNDGPARQPDSGVSPRAEGVNRHPR